MPIGSSTFWRTLIFWPRPGERDGEQSHQARPEDLCVSKPSFTWGVPVDFDPGHVVYVWVDALFNSFTAWGFLNDKYLMTMRNSGLLMSTL